ARPPKSPFEFTLDNSRAPVRLRPNATRNAAARRCLCEQLVITRSPMPSIRSSALRPNVENSRAGLKERVKNRIVRSVRLQPDPTDPPKNCDFSHVLRLTGH